MMNDEKSPSGYPEATFGLSGSQRVGTRKPPSGYPEATPRLPRGYPEATPRLPLGYPEATPRLPWAANGENGLPSLGTRGASRSRQYGFPFLGLTTTCWSLFGD